jgi:hypothetical protein
MPKSQNRGEMMSRPGSDRRNAGYIHFRSIADDCVQQLLSEGEHESVVGRLATVHWLDDERAPVVCPSLGILRRMYCEVCTTQPDGGARTYTGDVPGVRYDGDIPQRFPDWRVQALIDLGYDAECIASGTADRYVIVAVEPHGSDVIEQLGESIAVVRIHAGGGISVVTPGDAVELYGHREDEEPWGDQEFWEAVTGPRSATAPDGIEGLIVRLEDRGWTDVEVLDWHNAVTGQDHLWVFALPPLKDDDTDEPELDQD